MAIDLQELWCAILGLNQIATSIPGPVDFLIRCRYVDKFERRDGQWKIAHRRVVYEPGRIDAVTTDMPIDPTSQLTSSQDPNRPRRLGPIT